MNTGEQLNILNSATDCISFGERYKENLQNSLFATNLDILQINVGKLCNLSCKHCHVEAGPLRTEIMSKEILSQCLNISNMFSTIDITGGSPEMNPHLEWFINEAASLKKRLIVRTNCAILDDPLYSKFIDIYTNNNVEIVTSVPHYHSEKTDRQRGTGVFQKLINAMKFLNKKGYGKTNSNLTLNLVHNPTGTYLPGSQKSLEAEFKKRLFKEHSIVFNNLFSITNIPIGRYLEYLIDTDNLQDYMSDLCSSFNPVAAENVMCRTTLSVGWDGVLYDCDFNQMLGIPLGKDLPKHISDFNAEQIQNRKIVTGNHCYGCTAGSGSSCQGATIQEDDKND